MMVLVVSFSVCVVLVDRNSVLLLKVVLLWWLILVGVMLISDGVICVVWIMLRLSSVKVVWLVCVWSDMMGLVLVMFLVCDILG